MSQSESRSALDRRAQNPRILITGSSGLIGSAVARAFEMRGVEVVRFDQRGRGTAHGDVRDRSRLGDAVAGATGIIHLAAVSRVIWGERDPGACWATNVDGTRNVLDRAAASSTRPWVIFASSREVYGQPDVLPANEDTPLRPLNIYGRSKAEGERLVVEARSAGLSACTIRLSNVFGSATDHADRVVPAFVRGAAAGKELRIDGADHTFDFTFIDDVARGIASLATLLGTGTVLPPPIQFVSGRPTTLAELATLAIQAAGTKATIAHAPPRSFDVARFVGDGARARHLLDWHPRVDLLDGLARLLRAFQEEREPIGAAWTEEVQ